MLLQLAAGIRSNTKVVPAEEEIEIHSLSTMPARFLVTSIPRLVDSKDLFHRRRRTIASTFDVYDQRIASSMGNGFMQDSVLVSGYTSITTTNLARSTNLVLRGGRVISDSDTIEMRGLSLLYFRR